MGETLEVRSGGAKFGFRACMIQRRVSDAWVDYYSVDLDLTQGTSHTRQDYLTITGDAADSTVVVSYTTNKGHAHLRSGHLAQLDAEESRGIMFEWDSALWSGVVSAIEKGRDHSTGGYMEEADATLVCNRAQFVEAGKMPQTGCKFLIDGEPFQSVGDVTVGDWSYSFELKRCNRA